MQTTASCLSRPRHAGFPPSPRTLIHPGPFSPVRIHSLHSPRGRHVRLSLAPGLSLFDALVLPLRALGIHSASTTILGGAFRQLNYCVAPPDPSGRAAVAYTDAIEGGASYMIFGNATLGKSVEGAPLVHCHAAVRTAAGIVRGGHILTSQSIVGDLPIPVLVTSLDDFELRVVYDAETNLSLLQPQGAHHA